MFSTWCFFVSSWRFIAIASGYFASYWALVVKKYIHELVRCSCAAFEGKTIMETDKHAKNQKTPNCAHISSYTFSWIYNLWYLVRSPNGLWVFVCMCFFLALSLSLICRALHSYTQTHTQAHMMYTIQFAAMPNDGTTSSCCSYLPTKSVYRLFSTNFRAVFVIFARCLWDLRNIYDDDERKLSMAIIFIRHHNESKRFARLPILLTKYVRCT